MIVSVRLPTSIERGSRSSFNKSAPLMVYTSIIVARSGRPFSFRTGTTILLPAPDSGFDGRLWRPLAAILQRPYRVLTDDRALASP